MKKEIVKIELISELDIVLAHKHAIQIGEITGISNSDQTRFATAISEIARNCIEYSKTGLLIFFIVEVKSQFRLEAHIIDEGKGISSINEILDMKNPLKSGRGRGIVNSRRLVDHFEIKTGENKGTYVILCQKIPSKHPPINAKIIEGWREYFKNETNVSPYEEIKKRNTRLLEIAEQLRVKQFESEYQLEENKKLLQKLEKTNSGLQEFAYTISHDLKTPLTSLILWSSMASSTDDVAKKTEFIEKINLSAKRLSDTINGLIQIIDVKSSPEEVAENISIYPLVKIIISEFSLELKRIDAKLHIDTNKCQEFIYIKPFLRSILSNLLSNAIKYRSNERPLEILITTERRDGMVLLTVKDNGIGMDLSKTGGNLFKPFTRFNHQIEGRGIGLNIIKNMVKKNDGRIDVESEPEKGTSFKCYLKEYALEVN